MRKSIVAAIFAVVCIALAAGQEMRPTPGPVSGIVKVEGTVDVGRLPPVEARQLGDWRVAVTNTPSVQVAPAEFLKVGTQYAVTWPDGVQEVIGVEQVLPSAWVRTTAGGRIRWVNLALARSIQESR